MNDILETAAALQSARDVANILKKRMRRDVMGRDDVIEQVIIALLADGHVLLEDYPGSGKTTLAKALGAAIQSGSADIANELPDFRRIQFTPDMLPSDITGVMIFNTDTNSFHFRRGPIFACIVLGDEINRTTPKVQAALLEAMAEKQVTVDDRTWKLNDLFFVIATQNPLDQIGTYPLPVAQLDRFLFKIRMHHIDRVSELEVLQTWGLPKTFQELPTASRNQVLQARQAIRQNIYVAEAVQEALIDLAQALRSDHRCTQGISTRSLVQAIPALQARALLQNREFVQPEDLEALAVPIFQHRIVVAPGAGDPSEIVAQALIEPLERLQKRVLQR